MDDDLELNAKTHHEMVDSYESDRHQSQPFRITDKEGIGENRNMEDRNVQPNSHTREGSMTNSMKEDLNEKVVIERNGNFEVVAVKDLSQEERKIYANGSLNNEAAKSVETSNVEPLTTKKSTVRPGKNSAIGELEKSSQGKSHVKVYKNKDFHERKLKPANEKLTSGSSSTSSSFNNNHMRKKKENVEDRNQQQKQDSGEHFQNWLERKKKDEREKRERLKKDNKENDDKQKEESEEAYNKWKVEKERQLQRERKMKDDEEKYYRSQCETHTATECERNYKRWLIAKQQEAKAKEDQRRQKIKVYSLLIRQSQNSGSPRTNGVQGNSLYLDYHTLKF